MNNIKKRICIIEDTPELSKAVSFALQEAGFDVEVAENGKDGIKKIKDDHFSLILLDLVIPEKSGFEVMSATKNLGIKTPIIIYSNLPSDFSRVEALKMGAKDYIEKSNISLEELVARIKKFVK